MSQQLQLIFSRAEEVKYKMRDLRRAFKEALESSEEYQQLSEKIKTIRERRKQIENSLKESFSSEITKLEDLSIDLDSDNQLLSDAALSALMKGETIEVVDQYQNRYEPVFTVKFKKV